MNKIYFKTLIPHFIALLLFFVIPLIYFSPVIEGKVIAPNDVAMFEGMAKEVKDFRTDTGEEALWTNSMFGGMPSYLISIIHSGNKIRLLHKLLNLWMFTPVAFLFVSMICFYILLMAFRIKPYLAIIGSIAYAFSSYFIIIIIAGHVTKTFALAYMPALVGGFYLTFQEKKLWLGSIVYSLFLSLQLITNHYQIVYYSLLIVLILGVIKLIAFIKGKKYVAFLKIVCILFGGTLLALGTTAPNLWTTYEYGKDSMRGKSELTHDEENKTTGLDKDYATAWSYGIDETLTLLIPNFKGGESGGALSTNSETYKLYKNAQGAGYAKQVIKSLPLYWGTQPFTSGPVYIGAFIMFLFILSLFVLKGEIKWWLLSATILSVLLAWGNNFMWFTELFLDYFPGYNKFRTVSMILIIAELTIPLMAILLLKKIIDEDYDKKLLLKQFKYSFYIVGGICLFFALLPGAFFSFTSEGDQRYIQGGMTVLVEALQVDRKALLQQDALRSLIFVFLGAGTLWFFIQKKIKLSYFYLIIGFLILVDLWTVDKRYLNNDDFVSKRKADVPFTPTKADEMILEDQDPNFRVLNLTVNTFNDASTSYFHKSIGGYHGAKMKRYQELIDFQISKNNMAVLNMLNTKYFIVPTEDQQPFPRKNPDALGNVWFVDSYNVVENADEEIKALTNFNPKKESIIDKRWESQFESFSFMSDSTRKIELVEYKPNHLTYSSNSKTEQMAVFSEIFYDKGWNAYVDGELYPHFRCNYVLRGMIVPRGKHTIEYKFEPKSYYLGNKISLASSILLIIAALGVFFFEIKKHLTKD
jgi:Bacterial membrane protein YfhO